MLKATRIHHYLTLMNRWGVAEADVLAGTGIDSAALANPEFLVDAEQFRQIISNMLSHTDREDLGLYCGDNISFVEMGTVGYVLASAPTLRRALGLWFAYNENLFGSLISVRLDEGPGHWYLDVDVGLPLGMSYRFCLEEFLILCRATGQSLSKGHVQFSEIQLVIPQPAYHEKYQAQFNCPVHFNCSRNRIVVVAPNLDSPIQHDSSELNDVYLRFFESMSGVNGSKDPLVNSIRNEFITRPDALPNIKEMANILNCGERTLRRRLHERDTSYREMVDEFRLNLAKQYLSTPHLSITEIGDLLGFADSKSFLRAFKRWTGVTTKSYREQATPVMHSPRVSLEE